MPRVLRLEETIVELCKKHKIPQDVTEEILKGEALRITLKFAETDGLENAILIAWDWLMLSEIDEEDDYEDDDGTYCPHEELEREIEIEEWLDVGEWIDVQ